MRAESMKYLNSSIVLTRTIFRRNIGRFMMFGIERLLRGWLQMFNRSEDEVRRAFHHVNPNKATSQNNTAPRVLKASAEQLACIFCIIFCACFSTNTVPAAWKTACIVPVPKRPVIPSMNDLRPVVLTSAAIKLCELVVLCKVEILWKITLSHYSLPTGETGVPMMLFLYS